MSQPKTAFACNAALETLPRVFAPTDRTPKTAATPSPETLRLTALTYRDRTFAFNRELIVRVTQEEDGWAFDSDDPELFGFGRTRSEAEQSFCFDFSSCWRNIACEEDSKLAPDAAEMKRTLLGLVSTHRG